MIRSNDKALSPVIASIVLIAVTMAVAVVVASWMGGMTIGLMGNAEQTKITNVAFPNSPENSVNVTILNAGASSVTLQSATIDGDTANMTTTGPTYSLTINKGTYANVLVANSESFVSGAQYTIKIITAKGNTLVFTSEARAKAITPTSTPDPTPVPTPPPQVTFVSAGAGSGTTGNPKPKYPSGMESGDLILLHVTVQDITTTPPTPDGFTALFSAESTSAGRQWIYYKFATGSEPKSLTISIPGSVTKMARMYAFSNVSQENFLEDASFGSGIGSTIYARAITTAGDSRLAVSLVFVSDNNAVGSFVGETGGDWFEAVKEFKTSSGSDGCIQLQIATMATTGQLTGGSYSMSASDPWSIRSFALIPR